MSDEPDLHLLADAERIEPLRLTAKRVAFVLPADAKRIELGSRFFVPAHVAPASRDGRVLGVCVEGMQLNGEAVSLDDARLFGGAGMRSRATPAARVALVATARARSGRNAAHRAGVARADALLARTARSLPRPVGLRFRLIRMASNIVVAGRG
jgi:hypothetical protein